VTELGAYHLDLCEPEAQAAIDAHLPTCPDCVRAYLSAKRALTIAPTEKPRAEVRARLRAEVARTFPSTRERLLTAARRPVPVYKSAAVSLALAAAVALVPRLFAPVKANPVVEIGPYVDAARPHAEGFTVY